MLPDHDHPNYNCMVTTDTGVQRRLFANWLHNNGHDLWHEWYCDAGHTRFYIDSNFDIWSGMCENDKLGNVLEEWHTQQNAFCKQKTCSGCTDDLITMKFRGEDGG